MTDFIEAIRNATGGAPSLSEIIPGKLIRFATSDKRGDESGWCKLFDDQEGGVFGCWRQGINETWQADRQRTPSEQAAFHDRVKKAREEAKRLEAEQRAECRQVSAALWDKGRDVDAKHPYLVAKQVKPYGVRQLKESLLVPVRDSGGTLHGLQFIGPDGSKIFKKGTAVAGCYHAIGKPNGKLLIAEGFATAATLHEITGLAVAVAFNAGNLKPVTEALRAKLPDTLLIVCADDDHAIEGNPGLTKAAEAARAVNGLLAVPTFPATRGPKDTDFNDLVKLTTPEAVRACIEGAATVSPSPEAETPPESELESHENPLDAAIARLAALSPLQYDLVRKAEAKALGVRPGTLDAAVKNARKGSDNDNLPFTEVDPWPEPVDPARLLTDIAKTIRRFIVCNEEVAQTVALWVAMTWFIDVVQVAPLAVITAPEKRCGKSQLLFLLGRLSARAITASSISPAALFRTIDAWNPTILIDEADACMKDNEELRGLLNSGHTRDSAYVIRTVGDTFTPTKFNTWGAKALAGIGHVADTLMDRAVILELRRKLSHEVVERIRHAEPGLFDTLQSKLARFADDYSDKVRQARPPLPNSLNDRAQDNWEPLLAIAMTASNEWLKIGTTAALKLSGGENASQTIGTELLSDIQEVFEEKQVDRISTAELIKALCADDEKPWATYNRGLPIKPRQLASKLNGYDIHSKSIRIGYNETPKGYERNQFEDAFFRYIPTTPENIRHTPQTATSAALPVADYPTRCVNETQNATPRTATSAVCGVVADRNPLPEEEIFLTEDDLLEVSP